MTEEMSGNPGWASKEPRIRRLVKQVALALDDVMITPTVDRLSRDTTDLLVIARDIAAGETQRSIARSYNVSQSTISRLTS